MTFLERSLALAIVIALAACGRLVDDTQIPPSFDASVEAEASIGIDASEPIDVVTINGDAWLAFDSNRDGTRGIYFVRADGTGLQRFTTSSFAESQPAFAPDGSKLAFTSNASGAPQVFIVDLGTHAVSQLTSKAGGAAQPSWSRDGKLVAYVALAESDAGQTQGVGDVYVVHADGSGDQKVASPSANAASFDSSPSPVFTADSSGVVYLDYETIRTIRLDGTGARDVAGCVTTSPETPAMSPDGSLMAYAVWLNGEGIRTTSFAGYCQCPNDNCSTLVVEPGTNNVGHERDRRPSWSVDDVIAYERVFNAPADIAIISVHGGAPISVTHDGADDRNPTWAPSTFHP